MFDAKTDVWGVATAEFPRAGSPAEMASFLVRFAILAPSSHNAQPWTFRINDLRVEVHLDDTRWLKVADADRRELYLSVGCALENLLIAAEHFGFAPQVSYLPAGPDAPLVAEVDLSRRPPSAAPPRPPDLFHAIGRRHTNRREYDGRPLPERVLTGLSQLAQEPGIEIRFTDRPDLRRLVDELTVRADVLQFSDPEWRKELGHWLGQGLLGTNWLVSKAAQLAVSHLNLSRGTAKKDHALLDTAPLLGLVGVRDVSRESQVKAGQVFERVFLGATHAGLAVHPMNQVLQIQETRSALEGALPQDWGTPQLVFRLGYAEQGGPSGRRPPEAVIAVIGNQGGER